MNTVTWEWSIDSWLNSKLLNDDQKVIATVRDYDRWWWWNPRTKVIIRIRNSNIIDYDVFVRENTSLFRNLRDLSKRIDDVVVLRILLQLVTSAIFLFFHLDTSQKWIRSCDWCCRRPETTCTDFDRSSDSFSSLESLSFSLSAIWSWTRVFSRASSSRLLEFVVFQKRRHCWRRTSDCRFLTRTYFRRTLDVWRRSERRSDSDSFHESLGHFLRDWLFEYCQLTTLHLRFLQRLRFSRSDHVRGVEEIWQIWFSIPLT